MPELSEVIGSGRRVGSHRPWPRAIVDADVWRSVSAEAGEGRWTLLGLWGEPGAVHMALLDAAPGEIAVLSFDCAEGRFPSVGRYHPPAIRLERAIRDLFGLDIEDAPDLRGWLDH